MAREVHLAGQSQGVESYDAANDYTEDTTVEGETLSSTGTDENVAHISEGAKVSIKNSTITRESSDSQGGDNSSFYGVGAAVLATDGEAYVSNSTIDTDSKGAAGLFAYGDGIVYAGKIRSQRNGYVRRIFMQQAAVSSMPGT